MKINNKIRRVIRAGGLVETNSSSSHALCICGNKPTYAKPGDPEFDLDIHDGVLFVPNREGNFGWEWEKSNSCLTKLQYVCGLFFNNYQPLSSQKKPHRLEKILKEFLGVNKVVFEWEEKYLESLKEREEAYLSCPEIDHNSYSESQEEILESKETIIDFIFNKNSWFYGGNDNSSEPRGYYKEMKITDSEPNGTVTIDFSPGIGKVDFRVDLFWQNDGCFDCLPSCEPDIVKKIEQTDKDIFDSIVYHNGKFEVSDRWSIGERKEDYSYFCEYLDEKKNNLSLVYISNRIRTGELVTKLMKSDKKETSNQGIIDDLNKEDYILVPVSIISDEFGSLYE